MANSAGQAAAARGARAPAGRAPRAGLVSLSTSGTPSAICTGAVDSAGVWLRCDPHRSRLRRMRRSVMSSARLLEVDALLGGFRLRRLMITLTYRPEASPAVRDIAAFRDRMRQWFKRRGVPCRFVWVREAHKSGRPHFHVLVWLPRRFMLPAPDRRGWWPHGLTQVKPVHSGASYVAKYVSKGSEPSAFPKGCRIHGAGGLCASSRRERRWWLLPLWARRVLGGFADPVRVRGGWCDRNTGLFAPSPWVVVVGAGGIRWVVRPFELGESCNASSSQICFA